jgi:hypothetical protein
MPYAPFHSVLPDLALRETRSVTIIEPTDDAVPLPPDEYAFIELYCDEAGCDCQRVMFDVVSHQRMHHEAIIAFGWETPDFYARWLHDDDADMIAELIGPVLNLCSRQSPLAPALLRLTEDVLLADPVYMDRLKEHYRLFREHVERGPRQGNDAREPGRPRPRRPRPLKRRRRRTGR